MFISERNMIDYTKIKIKISTDQNLIEEIVSKKT